MKFFCELNWRIWGLGAFASAGGGDLSIGIAVMLGPLFFGVEWGK